MKTVKNRVLSLLLAVVLAVGCVVPAFAVNYHDPVYYDPDSVNSWNSVVNNNKTGAADTLISVVPGAVSIVDCFWYFVNNMVTDAGLWSPDRVRQISDALNSAFANNIKDGSFKQLFSSLDAYKNQKLADLLGLKSIYFDVQKHPVSGLWRIKEMTSGLWLVRSDGSYPYYDKSEGTDVGGNKWISVQAIGSKRMMMTKEALANMAQMVGGKMVAMGNYYYINNSNYTMVYANPQGLPFAAWVNDEQVAVNQPRPDTSVVEKDENGETINNIDNSQTDNSTNIDLSGWTVTLPDGTVNVADQVIYDESNNTYYIDSHDVNDNSITYNYSWTYHINYTSVTYIGTTAEYDKYYEVYYELPDGRDSADLTAEEVEQLNVNIDCIGYARSTDDVSQRVLYHFDGDTRDASYWNYCTDFHWNSGASLTYMDAGVFNGALYLDETGHDFTITLPSAIGAGDFTLQFRYYQSYTAAPKTDSYIMLGGQKLFQFTGGYFLNASGSSLAATPTGTWNEIALIRESGTLYYYLNGVKIGSIAKSTPLTNAIQFVFGSTQKTYKYFDELRFTNYALASGGENYTCTSVPYDTNLSLVLPDSVTPVADEYVSWTDSPDLIQTYDFCQTSLPFVKINGDATTTYPFGILQNGTNYAYYLSPATSGTVYYRESRSGSGYEAPGLRFHPKFSGLAYGTYDIIIYDETYQPHRGSFSFNSSKVTSVSMESDIYRLSVTSSDAGLVLFYFASANTANSATITRIDIISSGGELSTGELVTGIVPIPTEDLAKATLAVKTDLTITNHQIGGVRPSYPEKGLVWAMVESGFIRSLQIYNGSAWEACDGRIWTGSRWVPYGSYNVITLQDYWDVDGATPDYEYIYTESGFWSWWQKSWNAFTEKLFSALGIEGSGGSDGSGGSGSSQSFWDKIKDAITNGLAGLIETLFGLIGTVLGTLLSLVTDTLSFFFDFLTDTVLGAIGNLFSSFGDGSLTEFFQQPAEDGSTGTGLPGEVSTGFVFISGVIMALPPDLRMILFFALGMLILFSIFKMVKS